VPAWPGRDRSVEELNKAHPDPELVKLKLNHVVDHMEVYIKGLDEKPAIIGHSMGGLAVQILLQRDVAVAGVAIDPARPQVCSLHNSLSLKRISLPSIRFCSASPCK